MLLSTDSERPLPVQLAFWVLVLALERAMPKGPKRRSDDGEFLSRARALGAFLRLPQPRAGSFLAIKAVVARYVVFPAHPQLQSDAQAQAFFNVCPG